jgi:2C-methyl-D-erythritol 2,4-cyclodiphosphate synthase
MTRKDYVAIAEAIALTVESYDDVAVHAVADAIASVFASDNPRFDRGKFLTACGF